ncbi:MAG: YicC family protein [Firmicutes bacterium HGW-Firmicutes-16]|nr:MAG: YicC family protein [Firmicutes bacterium HGW-Firmicutes-16]
MVKSMTGYGGAKSSEGTYKLSVELKSVNNRYLDTSVRLPRSFMYAEETVKSAVQAHVSRGKVDVFISFDAASADGIAVILNEGLASGYKAAIESIGEKLGLDNNLTAYQIAKLPDVLALDKKELEKDEAQKELMRVLERALADFDTMRQREGKKLFEDISSRLNTLESFITFIELRSPQSVEEYRERLTKRMQEILESKQIDESRILTEAAIYADHIATDEETVRLRSHIEQIRGMLTDDAPSGRKLDFIVQELNRETNTIGSKCNSGDITRTVLDMKSEIEKIREQVQNIE